MKKFTGLINRTKSQSFGHRDSFSDPPPPNTPEATVAEAIRLFCESGGSDHGGEEIAQLPVIVEAAESSPAAAARAAYQIRKFLGRQWQAQPYLQYNAIMLIRILSDNPGATFTRNFDKNFVSAVKELLRTCKEQNTQQILRETLDALEADKAYDEGLYLLLQMWRKEKGSSGSFSNSRGPSQRQPSSQPANAYGQQPWPPNADQRQWTGQGQQRSGSKHKLPSPAELAGRVEEARNTAKILLQLIQSTPSEEVVQNDLIREFSERCQTASRSMQNYINADNPQPDHDTMQTLIETNEQLSLAMSRYQRALLAARRALGAATPSPNPEQMQHGTSAFAPPASDPSPPQQQSAFNSPPSPPTTRINGYEGHGNVGHTVYPRQNPSPPTQQASNPFLDPVEHQANTAPLAIEPSNYGTSYAPPQPPPRQAFSPPQQQPPPPPQSFSIISNDTPAVQSYPVDNRYSGEHSAPGSGVERHHSPTMSYTSPIQQTTSPGNLTPVSQPSPILSRAGAPSDTSASYTSPNSLVSPNSPPRPGPGPWHQSDITPSFVHRQSSAANGLTMHGAGSGDDAAVEIDGHSEVGRRERDLPMPSVGAYPSASAGAGAGASRDEFIAEHVDADHSSHRHSRVDVAGTGGFRSPTATAKGVMGAVFRH